MQQMAHYLGQVVAKEQQMQQAAQSPVEGGTSDSIFWVVGVWDFLAL